MAENVERGYFEILDELLVGNDSAIEKYAKVRHTQYEMNLWRKSGLPLNEVRKAARQYFRMRFLQNVKIEEADKALLDKGFERLSYAVGQLDGEPTGCHMRCLRLVSELNEALRAEGLQTIANAEKFLNWLCFDSVMRMNENGIPIREKPYGFVIMDFYDDANRKDFRSMVRMLKTEKRVMSMQDIWRMIDFKRKHSKTIK